MEDAISRIVGDIEALQSDNLTDGPHSQQTPISESTLAHLRKLLDRVVDAGDSEEIDRLYEGLSSKGLSPTTLVRWITSAMDSCPTALSLMASKVYLSLLLSPNAPVFTLFTPMAFLSLLRSVRLSLRRQSPEQPPHSSGSDVAAAAAGRKRKGGGRSKRALHSARKDYHDDDGREGIQGNGFDVRVLFGVLDRLQRVLGLVHLGRFPDSLKSLIQAMAELPVAALDLSVEFGNYTKLFNLCSRILSDLLQPEHGEQADTAAEISKSLTALILMHKSQARSSALDFVKTRMVTAAGDSDGIKKALVNLPRYLAHKAPEKSELRASAVESIMDIIRTMEFEDQIGFADYVVKMTKGIPQLRLLAVDLVPMLMMSLRDPFGVKSGNDVNDSWGMRCLEALIERCSDVSAVIRARALSNVAQLVGFLSGDACRRDILKKVMRLGTLGDGRPEGGINELLRNRCMDEKAGVRKASLVLITKLTALLGGAFDADVVKTVGMACSDPLVSIRKAAISALSEALRTCPDGSVIAEWLHSVPRLISDSESSIQEECENLFLELVLDWVSRASSLSSSHFKPLSSSSVEAEKIELPFPEGVLGLLVEICNGEVAPWVRKICTSLGKKKRLRPKIAIALQNIIKTSESLWLSHSRPIESWKAPPGAWFLLSEVSAFLCKAVDWEFLHHHWMLLDKHGLDIEYSSPYEHRGGGKEVNGAEIESFVQTGDQVFLLQTISNVSVELPPEPAAGVAHNLLQRLEDFNMHSTEVDAHVKALRTLCKSKALNPEEADVLVMRWVQQVLSKATSVLDTFITKAMDANKENNFLSPPRVGGRKGKNAASVSRLLPQAIAACYTIGSLVIVCPSVDLNAIIPILHTIITSGSFNPKFTEVPAVSIKQTAPSLYVQAWLTMGKICLADGKLAKKYIPLFVQELEKSSQAALRNNIVVMMADFCVCYTALVDCYISRITKCLRDPCELVRRQTFILLSRLLQRDYVKWRGVLFLRFLLSLVDESEKIRQLADFLFGNILKAKAPLLAYNSFVEAIFVLNDCHVHTGHNESQSSQTEDKLFCIRGSDEASRSKRMHIYVSLLKQMAPEHLLATFAKLCAEILAAASDGMLNIEHLTARSVLQDAFQILACKEIRIPTMTRSSPTDMADMDEEGGSAAAAGGKAVTQAIRKSLVQNTIPIFIELKRLLESKNSPLIGSLMECLRNLLKDYKSEIDEILDADKQLRKELLYDIQKYEAAKARSTAALTPMQGAEKLESNTRVGSGKDRSRFKEVNQRETMVTPPLSALKMPKLKSCLKGDATAAAAVASSVGGRTAEVLHSLRRRQCFSSDEED